MKIITLLTAIGLSTSLNFAGEKLVIKGSDTLGAKLVPQLKEEYNSAGNKVEFEIAAEGSSSAFSNLIAGTCQIGMSSREAKSSEKDKFTAQGKELTEHVAAWDMIAVILNEDNPVKNLTIEEIEGIFTGDIVDWSEVGGEPGEISVYTRNTSSGTYKSFQKLAMNKRDYGSQTQKMAGNEAIASEVASNINGVGYVGLAYTEKDGIKSSRVNGVKAKPKFKSDYAISRKLYYYTVGEPEGNAKNFINWATSDESAATVVKRVGFIPVN